MTTTPYQIIGDEIVHAYPNCIGALRVHSGKDLLIPNSSSWDAGTVYTTVIDGAQKHNISAAPRSGWRSETAATLHAAAQLTREKIEILYNNYPALKEKYGDKFRYYIELNGHYGNDPVYLLKYGSAGLDEHSLNCPSTIFSVLDMPNDEYLDTRFAVPRGLQLTVLNQMRFVFDVLPYGEGTCGSLLAPELIVWRTRHGSVGYRDHALPNYKNFCCDLRLHFNSNNQAFLCIYPLHSPHGLKIGVVVDEVVKRVVDRSGVLVNDLTFDQPQKAELTVEGESYSITIDGFIQPIWWWKLREHGDIR